jgi:secreted protein with Ig-like and vWFA domain
MKTIKQQLLSCTLQRVRVKLPEFGLDLYVQEMSAEQRIEYYAILASAISNKTPQKNVAARILLPSLLDLDGNMLFDEDEVDKLEALSPQVVTKLTNSLLEVSGLTSTYFEAEKKRLMKARSTNFISSWLTSLENLSRKFLHSRLPK